MKELQFRILLVQIILAGGGSADPVSDDFGDHAGFAHAMGVETRVIDGFPVVFQYGKVRPEFGGEGVAATRKRTILSRGWRFRFDPDHEGSAAGWAGESVPDDGWTDVEMPHCWDMMPGGRFYDWSVTSPANPPHYNGAAWYRVEFTHEMVPSKRYRIEFLGVQQRAVIFLNGKQIAMHEGGGQPFSIDVTNTLRSGKNVLAARVIRRANHEPYREGYSGEPAEIGQIHGPYPKAPDCWPYAGITREVALITECEVALSRSLFRTTGSQLDAAIVVSNSGIESGSYEISLDCDALAEPIPPMTRQIGAGEVRVLRFTGRLRHGLGEWSPASPVLHPVTVRLRKGLELVDEWRGGFGRRIVTAKDGRLLLNGRPIFLKGVAMYEETRQRGAALLPADHERLLGYCREADANFIRLQVIQRSPLVYQMADRLGFMVTGEWGGFWYRERAMDAQTKDSRSVFQSHARCAIWDLMNHPSVILWCVHNESHQFCPEYERFVAKATEIVRELDWQGRPVTWAAWHPHMGRPGFQHGDVVGFNEYRGAMDPFERLEPDMQRVTRGNPGKPLVIMENGAWARQGTRGAKEQKGTEDWQADLLLRQHAVLSRHVPPLAGYTYWILTDYRSRKYYTANERADGYSAMGLYGPDGQIKLVRDVFRDLEWPVPQG